jgi:hypothetical protein
LRINLTRYHTNCNSAKEFCIHDSFILEYAYASC